MDLRQISPSSTDRGAYAGAVLGIMAAMDHEVRAIVAALASGDDHATTLLAGRTVHHGTLEGTEVVAVRSGIGKVDAAVTATLLAERFGVDRLLMVGTAGGLHPDAQVGDVVVADALLQHDLDPTPLLPRWVVPALGVARLATDPELTAALARAADEVVARGVHTHPGAAGGVARAPRAHLGLVVSGDTFVSDAAASQQLRAELPDALAVEMEGAAVAQACHELGVRLAVARTVSDRADDDAHGDFVAFVEQVAAPYAHDLVVGALRHLRPTPGR